MPGLLIFGLAVGSIFNPQKCYGELGCFKIDGDFNNSLVRPIQLLPASPDEVGTNFRLYSITSTSGVVVNSTAASITSSSIDPTLPTIFIIHGFVDKGSAEWVNNMRKDILSVCDCNVFHVDWKKGAKFPYEQATANTRLVGAEIALLIQRLKEFDSRFQLSSVHLIGHSLGAHVAGYAGKRFIADKIGRIIGLDPAGLYFEGIGPGARLARTDATFVEAIHTNGLPFPRGFGMSSPVGDVDFYMNGGKTQPECFKNVNLATLITDVMCSHSRASEIFRATIRASCPHTAYRCDSYSSFKEGKCLKFASCLDSLQLGWYAQKPAGLSASSPNKYYMDTLGHYPFCGYQYRITIKFSGDSREPRAQFKLSLAVNSTIVAILKAPVKGYTNVKKGGSFAAVTTLDRAYDSFSGVSLNWESGLTWSKFKSWLSRTRRPDNIKIDSIEVFNAHFQKTRSTCSNFTLEAKTNYNLNFCE